MSVYEISTDDGSVYEVTTEDDPVAQPEQPYWTLDYGGDQPTLGNTILGASKGYLGSLADALMAVPDLVTYPFRKVDSGIFKKPGFDFEAPSDALKEVYSWGGLTYAPGEKAESKDARYAQRAGEFIGNALGLGSQLGTIPGRIGEIASSLPKTQILSSVLSGLSGQAVEESGGSPGWQLAAELGAGTAPSLVGALKNVAKVPFSWLGAEDSSKRAINVALDQAEKWGASGIRQFDPSASNQSIRDALTGSAKQSQAGMQQTVDQLTSQLAGQRQAQQAEMSKLVGALVPEGYRGKNPLSAGEGLQAALLKDLSDKRTAAREAYANLGPERYIGIDEIDGELPDILSRYGQTISPSEVATSPFKELSNTLNAAETLSPGNVLPREDVLNFLSDMSHLTTKGGRVGGAAGEIAEALSAPLTNEEKAVRELWRVWKQTEQGVPGKVAEMPVENAMNYLARQLAPSEIAEAGELAIPALKEAQQAAILTELQRAKSPLSYLNNAKNEAKFRSAFDDSTFEALKGKLSSLTGAEDTQATINAITGTMKQQSKTLEGKLLSSEFPTSQTMKEVLRTPENAAKATSLMKTPEQIANLRTATLAHILEKSAQEGGPGGKFGAMRQQLNHIFGEKTAGDMVRSFSREGTIGSKMFRGLSGETWKKVWTGVGATAGGSIGFGMGGPVVAGIGAVAGSAVGAKIGSIPARKSNLIVAALKLIGQGDKKIIDELSKTATAKNMENFRKAIENAVAKPSLSVAGGSDETDPENPKQGEYDTSGQHIVNPTISDLLSQLNPFNVNEAEASMLPMGLPPTMALEATMESKKTDHDFNKLRDAVIQAESGGKADAVSPKGAEGLMQIMPKTGAEWGKKLGYDKYNPKDPEQNKAIGTAYLKWLLDKFSGDHELALASYNLGIGNVLKLLAKASAAGKDRTWASIKEYAPTETKKYVYNVTKNYQA